MIMAGEVKHAMQNQYLDLVWDRVTKRAGIRGRDIRRDSDVTGMLFLQMSG